MNTRSLFVAALLAAATLPACTGPSKVLVSYNFRGADKTSKLLLLASGQIDPSTKKALFDVFYRICNIDARGSESACKDTKVIESVVPGTVY